MRQVFPGSGADIENLTGLHLARIGNGLYSDDLPFDHSSCHVVLKGIVDRTFAVGAEHE